jgi:glycosyltransferase involved in cell wall biosynthesis
VYGRNSVVILPVRYDSFNLVALEAVSSGCPTVVSNRAGVCDFLDERLPGVPYVKIDFDNFYAVVREIENLLANYTEKRTQLLDRLAGLKTHVGELELESFYRHAIENAANIRVPHTLPVTNYGEIKALIAVSTVRDIVRKSIPGPLRPIARKVLRAPRQTLIGLVRRAGLFNQAKLAWHAVHATTVKRRFALVNDASESSLALIENKIRVLQELGDKPLYRCNIWRELARLEKLRGNELTAVTYELRLIRLLGTDRFGKLQEVCSVLSRHGFREVAEASEVLYGQGSSAEKTYVYLKGAYERGRTPPCNCDWEHVWDRRRGETKVSIIVSLYKAAAKLRFFLSAISLQTLCRRGAVELILVDSGSPDNERDVLRDFPGVDTLNFVYARSQRRETIQAAWNRGITLSRSPYLVFLGVDETLYPEALERLAAELDRQPSVDWVMANSLVTEVDSHGVYKRDVMPYDRSGATKDHTYLETCYLSWVGGMYRKSLHERFGYYDETFRASGDTEFKNRVLPYINVAYVAATLGLFLNYPDERTTASTTAEIEDTRAWYLHRAPGGVKYAFDQRSPDDALKLFCVALGYRKSYCTHQSSDVEYAAYLLDYLKGTSDGERLDRIAADLASYLASMRAMDWTRTHVPNLTAFRLVRNTWLRAAAMERRHRRALAGRANPEYKVLNDNRYEQHFWTWKG